MRKSLTKFGITLARAFEYIVWQKFEPSGNTIWAEFAKLGTEVYRRTWLRFFELNYVGHFHPEADRWLKMIEHDLSSAIRTARRGRRPATKAESASLRQLYKERLRSCVIIHRAAKEAVASCKTTSENAKRKDIRKRIWESVRRDIHGSPSDGLIFDGSAFKRIPYAHKNAALHDPLSWSPQQLAKSLVSFERGLAYQTIEKKLGSIGPITKRR
jgi:hypothetical protein